MVYRMSTILIAYPLIIPILVTKICMNMHAPLEWRNVSTIRDGGFQPMRLTGKAFAVSNVYRITLLFFT